MVEAAEAPAAPEGPSDDQRLTDLEAKVPAPNLPGLFRFSLSQVLCFVISPFAGAA